MTTSSLADTLGAGSREPGAGSREPGAGSREPGAGSREPGAGSREPGAGSREPGAGSREPGAGSREPGAGSREPGAGSREPGAGLCPQTYAIWPQAADAMTAPRARDTSSPPASLPASPPEPSSAASGQARRFCTPPDGPRARVWRAVAAGARLCRRAGHVLHSCCAFLRPTTSAAVLAVAVVSLLAAGNALAQANDITTPTANADGSDTLWTATMTVEAYTDDIGTSYIGYYAASSAGSLSSDTFTIGSTSYPVSRLEIISYPGTTDLYFYQTSIGWPVEQSRWVLYLDETAFHGSDDAENNSQLTEWPDPGLSWTDGQTVAVRLVRLNKPTAPRDVVALDEGTSWALSWTAPEKTGGWLEYEYRHHSGDGMWTDWTDVPDSAPGEANAAGYTVDGLTEKVVYVFEVRGTNAAGDGPAATAESHNVPEITGASMRSSPLSGDTYGWREVIEFEVTFDGPVVAEGGTGLSASLFVDTWRGAVHTGGSGTDTFIFSYTVKAGDTDTDGVTFGANALAASATPSLGPKGGGTLRSPTGQDADLANVLKVFSSHKVDGTPPPLEIEFTSTPANMTDYLPGETVRVKVAFPRAVTVTGTPSIGLEVGAAIRRAAYASHSGSSVLFEWRVGTDDVDTDGLAVPADSLQLDGGTIAAADGTGPMPLAHAALGAQSGQKVKDRPYVTGLALSDPGADGFYGLGDDIVLSVTFSEQVQTGSTLSAGVTIDVPAEDTDHSPNQSLLVLEADGNVARTTLRLDYRVLDFQYDLDGVVVRNLSDSTDDTVSLDRSKVAYLGWPETPFPDHKVDGIRPELVPEEENPAALSADRTQILLIFTEDLDSTTAATTAFEVTVGTAAAVAPSGVSASGDTVTLTLAAAAAAGAMVSVTYTAPGAGADAIRDATAGNAANGFTVEVQTTEPPGAPQDLRAMAGTGKVRLTWDAPAPAPVGDAAITGYEYQRKEGGGSFGDWTAAETVAFGTASNSAILRDATTLDHYDVKAETTYTYRVRAVNAGGGGDASAEDSATTGAPMTVKVVVSPQEVAENEEDPVEATVVAELPATGPNEEKYDLEFKVVFFSEQGTALGHDDYTPFTAEPVFAPGDFEKEPGRWVARKPTRSVALIDDDVAEPDETFDVGVEKRTGGTHPSHPFVTFPGATDTATVTILNDDEAAITVTLDIEGLSGAVVRHPESSGTVPIVLRAEADTPPIEDFEVTYDVVDQTATAGTDYKVPDSLIFAFDADEFALENGKYVQTVTKGIELVDDEVVERTEYFELNVDSDDLPGHVTISADHAEAVFEISDGDAATVRIVEDVTVFEGEEFEVTLELDAAAEFTILVNVGFSVDDSLPTPAKFDPTLVPAEFERGETRTTVTVMAVDDGGYENDETFEMTVGYLGSTGDRITADNDPARTVTIKNDDHKPEVTTTTMRVLIERTEVQGRLRGSDADGDPLTWTITGGADAGLFTVTEDGQLSLDMARTLAAPGDANGDGTYELVVVANDGDNDSEPAAIKIELVEESAPSVPTGFRWLRAADEGGTATLVWGPPAHDGNQPILRYEIRTDAGAWETVPGGADVREITLTGLEYNQLYIYGLRAVNKVGPSGQTTTENVRLREGAPGAPRNLRSEAISAHEIRLTWERPSHGADIEIVGYRFEVSTAGRDWSYSTFTRDRAYEERTYGVAGVAGDEFRLDDPTPSTRDSIGREGARHYRVEALYVYRPAADDPYAGTSRSPVSAPVRASTEGYADTHPLAAFVLKDRTYLGPRLRVEEGATLVLSDPDGASHSIEAVLEAGASVGSVELELSGRVSHTRTDNTAPYNLFGDGVGTAAGRSLPAGDYTLTAYAYAEADGRGAVIQTRFVSFTVEGPPPPRLLTGLVLIDKDTNNEIAVADGATVNLPADGRYRLRANAARGAPIGSARLRLDGPPRVWTYTEIDNAAPYALTPGEGAMPPGTYRFRAWAWSGPDGYWDLLEMLEVSFTVAVPALTAFALVDATADEDRGAVEDGGTLTVKQGTDYSFRAEAAEDAGVKSVRLELEGPSSDVVTRTENDAPYTLHGEDGGDYAGAELAKGSYTLTATAFPRTGGAGEALQTLSVSFTVLATAPGSVYLEPLTAAFEDLPERHAAAPFEFRVVFSEALDIAEDAFRDHALDVTGGRVTAAARVADETGAWTVTVAPDSAAAVELQLASGRDCDADGALCTAAGTPLSSALLKMVAGPTPTRKFDGFTLVDAASSPQTVLASLTDGASVELADPDAGQYAIRADLATGESVGSVALSLTGAKNESTTDGVAPYSLYGDGGVGALMGESLPAGSYQLTATAYADSGGNGAVLDTLSVSFTVTAPATPLTAAFLEVPAKHGGKGVEFAFQVQFSEDVAIGYAALREAFDVGGGEVVKAKRVDGNDDLREIHVEATTDGEVTVALEAGRACDQGGVCTADGRTLSNALSATVAGPPPLTAAFLEVPAEHGGKGAEFTFQVQFSEDVAIGYAALREAFDVDGGDVVRAKRVGGNDDLREIHVEATTDGAVTVVLEAGRACDQGGICTAGGRTLSNAPSASVSGLPALSVADAEAAEAPGAAVAMAVTLSRAASGTVTVDYATADSSARAGEDYEEATGTLTFQPGETAKTVSVKVLDDAVDEGSESFKFLLYRASGARIANSQAFGTITNSDPLPQAWLARFGRTAADHALDAIGARVDGAGAPASHATFGGQRLWGGNAPAQPDADRHGIPAWPHDAGPGGIGGGPDGMGMDRIPGRAATNGAFAGTPWGGLPSAGGATGHGANATFGLSGHGEGMGDGMAGPGMGPSRTLRDLLLGSSFLLSDDDGQRRRLTGWGRAASSSFSGDADGVAVDGDVTTVLLGADAEWDRWLAGVAVSRSFGTGAFGGGGELDSVLTTVHPYARYAVNERLSAWGALGWGGGELTLAEEGSDAAWRTDTAMRLAAGGARGVFARTGGGLELAGRVDARLVRIASDGESNDHGNLAASTADTSRLRLVLESSRAFAFGASRTLTPALEIGLRHDGGDAETGAGVEIGGTLRYADARLGLTAEAAGRMLLAHEDAAYREWGASASVRIDPRTPGRGLTLTLSPAWGASATGGAERLWLMADARGLAGYAADAGMRLTTDVGYGLSAFRGRGAMTPYVGMASMGAGSRDWRAGVRWTRDATLEFGIEATRRETATEAAHGIEIRASLRW